MEKIEVVIDGEKFVVEFSHPMSMETDLSVNGQNIVVRLADWQKGPELWHWFECNGFSFEIDIDPELRWIKTIDGLHRLNISNMGSSYSRPISSDGRVKAPIPGLISKVFVTEGQPVADGERLLVLEAMKMENEIVAHKAGTVRKLKAYTGNSVALNEVMLTIE